MSGRGTSLIRLNHLRLADERAMAIEEERNNPVNPLRNQVIRGGFAVPTFGTSQFVGGAMCGAGITGSFARDARLAMADERAVEEQTMRMNTLSKGATPTMGLSRVRGGATMSELAKFGSDELKVHKEAHHLIGGKTAKEIADEAKAQKKKETEEADKKKAFAEEQRKINQKKLDDQEARRKYINSLSPEEREAYTKKANAEMADEMNARNAALNAFEGKELQSLEKDIQEYIAIHGREPKGNFLKRIVDSQPPEGSIVYKRYRKRDANNVLIAGPTGGCPDTFNRELTRFKLINGREPTPNEYQHLHRWYDENGKKKPEAQVHRPDDAEPENRPIQLDAYQQKMKAINEANKPILARRAEQEQWAKDHPALAWLDKAQHAIAQFGIRKTTELANTIDGLLGNIPTDIYKTGTNIVEGNGDAGEILDQLINIGVKVGAAIATEGASLPVSKYVSKDDLKNPDKPKEKPKPGKPELVFEGEDNADLGNHEDINAPNVADEFNADEFDDVYNVGYGRKRPMAHHKEAKEMGRALQLHLKKLHGGAYASAFATGMTDTFSDELKPELNGGFHSGAYEGLGTKKGMVRKTARKAYKEDSDSDLEGGSASKEEREALKKKYGSVGNMIKIQKEEALARMTPQARKAKEEQAKKFQEHKDKYAHFPAKKGGSRVGFTQDQRADMELSSAPNPGNLQAPPVPKLMAGGRAKRSPSKRNEIVKKVMREKGMKMIEASKYVKTHNLY